MKRDKLIIPTLAALAGALLSTPVVLGQESDPRIDPDTGRDVCVYPPDRLFDYLHMRLGIDIPDMAEPRFSARETLTVAPIGIARSSLRLRAGEGLTFSTIRVDGKPAKFSHTEGVLDIAFPAPVGPGQQAVIVMDYAAYKAGGGGAGLTWSKDDPRTPETDYLFHSQGQPESNHLWFACHDFPNERLTTELVVTAPKDYEVVSNGHLVGIKRFGDGSGRRTFHWLQDLSHPNYLVMMAVGRFDVVNVGGPKSARPGLWMPVYGPLGSGEAIRDIFANTPDMVAHFEKLFDEPYPWDKYAQVLVRDFAAGAMENTSATTFHPQFARGRRGSADSIIAHELVHQWFGDLATYKSWQHLWLGEGWATFGEALWAEEAEGDDGYQAAIMSDYIRESASRGYIPRSGGMVSNRYKDPQSRFVSPGDNVYSRGGFFLHMLRKRVGDQAFFKGSALYLDRFRLACAETDDFRKCLEEVSGESLERFFEQWAKRPGQPRIEMDLAWDAGAKKLSVIVEQMQRVDADNPAYAFTLPIYCDLGNDQGKWVYLDMDTTRVEGTFTLASQPVDVAIDPNMTLLLRSKVRQPLAAWLHQLRHGPTLFARVQAAEALADFDDQPAIDTLVEAAISPANHQLLRESCGQSLAVHGARRLGQSLAAVLLNLTRSIEEGGVR